MRTTVREFDARRRHIQVLGQQTDDSFVRLSLRRCCRRADPQRAIANVENFIAARSRLDSDSQHQVTAVPAGSAICRAAQIGIGFNVATKIATACKPMIAKIGEISRPPIDGMYLRKGRSIGSTSMAINAVAGL